MLDELELEGNDRKSGWLLLAMIYCGTTNPDKLWKLAKLDREFVRLRCKRLRENGVIARSGVFSVDWYDADWRCSNIAFMLDVFVAEGMVVRDGKDPDGRHHYKITEVGAGSLDDGPRGAGRS